MTIKENKNFGEVKIYNNLLTIDNILNIKTTNHLKERLNRLLIFDNLNNELKVDKIFVVDKFHRNGLELHCVLNKGIIIIINKNKYELYNSGMITILFARPNQVIRLYSSCGLKCPSYIINYCKDNVKKGYENI